MTTPKEEPPIPREQRNLEPCSVEQRVRPRALMLKEAFMDAPDGKQWRGQKAYGNEMGNNNSIGERIE
jgi:hypothetical protein